MLILLLTLLPWLPICSPSYPIVVPLNVPLVSRLAIWRSRAFLCVPSLPSTLLEITWQPSLPRSSRVRRFPVISPIRRCNGLLSATDLKIDVFGRLWVLDSGTDMCPPKLLVYDMLFYRLNEIMKHTFELGTVLNNLVIDSGTSRSLTMVYLSGLDKLYVYSVYQERSWMVHTNIEGTITGLAIDRGGMYQRSALLIEVDHLKVYQIFTASLQDPRAVAVELGELLGPNSSGLLSDTIGGVYYMLARDFVALRWDANLPLTAESHDIILQSHEYLTNVTYLTLDNNKNVWALANNNSVSWCVKLSD